MRSAASGLAAGLLLAAAAFAASCSDSSGTKAAGIQADAAPADITPDALTPDLGSGKDVAANDTDHADSTPDVSTVCPGGPGCPCATDTECDGNLCIEDPSAKDGKACAQFCTDTCASDAYLCAGIAAAGGDIQHVCVPRWGRLCDPCAASSDCSSLGLSDAFCVDEGHLGRFCGVSCGPGGACPTGYGCKTVVTAEGATPEQCVRLPDAGTETYGECPCSERAVKLGLATQCSAPFAASGGQPAGSCKGKRSCTAKGLGQCNAAAPQTETCNGQDDNCNGEIDEGTCDDGSSCTTDSCDPKLGCQHGNLDGTVCDADGNACTVGDTCQQGLCTTGKAKDCNDKNSCTMDACDAKKGCVHTADDGAPCSDKNECTSGDVCAQSQCQPGVATICPESACQSSSCNIADGACLPVDVSEGTACDDGLACTGDDACKSGACNGVPVVCNDNNPCTIDACDPKKGCTTALQGAIACDDANACTSGDLCQSGSCQGQALDCTDKSDCTIDSCDVLGGCAHLPQSASPCDDGDACSEGDACDAGTCKPGKAICACQKDADCADDGNACNGISFCDTGTLPYVCKIKSIVTCDQSGDTACLETLCQTSSGACVQVAVADGSPCSDGSACTLSDACAAGLCAAGKVASCDDGSVCTADSCDITKGCINAPVSGQPCDADGTVCTEGDACVGSVCQKGATLDCEDKNSCTADSCSATLGCVHTPQLGLCTDGVPCTDGDACVNGTCTPGPYVCGCTSDADCPDDGNLCNGWNHCELGAWPWKCGIQAGSVPTCDSSKDTDCAKIACQPATGACSLVAEATATTCSDGSLCTDGDHCQGGLCAPGSAVTCDDHNPCTFDSCDKLAGCQFPITAGLASACYPGEPKTLGVGTCAGGLETCDAQGVLGPCLGAVLPAAQEACDGKDDDCDGVADNGCAPATFRPRFTSMYQHVTDAPKTLRATMGASWVAGPVKGTSKTAWFGWMASVFGAVKG